MRETSWVTVLCEDEPVARDLSTLAWSVRGCRSGWWGLGIGASDVRVHVHVVRGKVERDEELEEQSEGRVGDGEEA